MPPDIQTTLKSPRTKLKRYAKRGHHDFDTVAAILDEGLYCHVGFVVDGQPYVIPTAYGREDRTVYIHGAAASRMLNTVATGIPVCITVTLLDGLVLARSGFNSSINYRSVVILGKAVPVEAHNKVHALTLISEHLLPGRWDEIRAPTRKELNATTVLAVAINEASAKIRNGPPHDNEADYALPCWAGVVPIKLSKATPVPDPRLAAKTPLPSYVRNYRLDASRSAKPARK